MSFLRLQARSERVNAQRNNISSPAEVPSHFPLSTNEMFAGLSTPTLEQSKAPSISLAINAKIVKCETRQTPGSTISRPSEAHESVVVFQYAQTVLSLKFCAGAIRILTRSSSARPLTVSFDN